MCVAFHSTGDALSHVHAADAFPFFLSRFLPEGFQGSLHISDRKEGVDLSRTFG